MSGAGCATAVGMSNAIRCIDQRFALESSCISSLALIFNFNNPRPTVLYAKKLVAGGDIRRVMYRFFRAIDTNHGKVVKVSRRESGDMGSIPVLKLSAAPRPFCVALSPSVH